MAGTVPKHDWERVFYDYAARPAHERSLRSLARELGVRPQTVTDRAKRDHWNHRLAVIDEKARQKREARRGLGRRESASACRSERRCPNHRQANKGRKRRQGVLEPPTHLRL
jgi:hypothetical protein